ncbi:sialate O-acetylesterase [Alteromonadaceae bacterium Bs31]|nr:sialate O-acetylesterase [Alteromonadaceae bacterium Bs31]
MTSNELHLPMQSHRAKRNLIAVLVGLAIIIPLASFNAINNKGIFFYLNKAKNKETFSTFKIDEGSKQIVALDGIWHFSVGDDMAWAAEDFDDSEWAEVEVPGRWEWQGFKGYDGFAWYRKELTLSAADLKRTLSLSLGTIDDADEAFLNGQKVGGMGGVPPTYISAWNQRRDYPLPAELLREGKNVIALRVYDAQQGGGIVGEHIGIYASNMPRPLVSLQGEWQFRVDESKDFHSIQVPGVWEQQGYGDYDGMAYYRKSFGALDVEPDEKLVLLLGKIDDTEEVTLNGEFIGRTGSLSKIDKKRDSHYFKLMRRYEFSSSLLKEENVLDLRVFDHGGEGGIYQGPVAIVRKKDLQDLEK